MSDEKLVNDERVTLYELGLNLVPTLEDKTQDAFDACKQIIEKAGGKVTTSSNPALIPLAYTMVKSVDSKNYKYDTASFGWIKFEAAPEVIADLKEDLDLNNDILRYIILKTTAEANTESEIVLESIVGKVEVEETESAPEEKTEDEDESKDTEDNSSDEEIDQKVDEAIDEMVGEEK